jgi:hypothetical protein|tara:strand:- start:894 stop:1151 length:258 start_codon:yes stop_codon:yes gene_type:complete
MKFKHIDIISIDGIDMKVNMEIEEKMMSLFDYLNKPAGMDLGGKVYATAKKANIPIVSKEVKTKNYEGQVMMYPEKFLQEYFSNV